MYARTPDIRIGLRQAPAPAQKGVSRIDLAAGCGPTLQVLGAGEDMVPAGAAVRAGVGEVANWDAALVRRSTRMAIARRREVEVNVVRAGVYPAGGVVVVVAHGEVVEHGWGEAEVLEGGHSGPDFDEDLAGGGGDGGGGWCRGGGGHHGEEGREEEREARHGRYLEEEKLGRNDTEDEKSVGRWLTLCSGGFRDRVTAFIFQSFNKGVS